MFSEYKKNKPLITAYLKNKQVENLHLDRHSQLSAKTIMGMLVGGFILLFVINILIYVWAIYLLSSNWNKMSCMAKGISLIPILFGFPIGTIVAVFMTRDNKPQEYTNTFDSSIKNNVNQNNVNQNRRESKVQNISKKIDGGNYRNKSVSRNVNSFINRLNKFA